MRKNTCAEVENIGSTFAQIGIFHHLEVADVFHHYLTQCALSPVALIDRNFDLSTQCVVVQHIEIDVEQSHLFRSQLAFELTA